MVKKLDEEIVVKMNLPAKSKHVINHVWGTHQIYA